MITFIIWLGAFLCPNPTHTTDNHGNCPLLHMGAVSTNDIGETGGTPKPPVPPPPPPPGNGD